MIRICFKLEDSLPLLWLAGLVLLLPTELLAQFPFAFRLNQAVSIDAVKPKFAATGGKELEAAEIEPTISFGRSSLVIQTALKPIVAKISPSVVEIRNEHDQVSLGTVVSSQGLIVCKHSELAEKFYCVLPDGSKYWGLLIGIHPAKDLALIQIAANDLTPIVFCQLQTIAPGSLVVSVGREATAVGFGLVSMPPHDFALQQPECKDCIDLGATVSVSSTSRQMSSENGTQEVFGLEVLRVYPRTAAESSGLLVGDLLRAINGKELTSRAEMNEVANSIKIGQILTLRVVRNGKPVMLSTKIKSFASPTLHDRWGGGPFSDRRFGFPSIIAHDSVVLPEHCGSPLVGLDGRVIGINIARSMRVATFSIPIKGVFDFVKLVRPNAKLQLESAAVSRSR